MPLNLAYAPDRIALLAALANVDTTVLPLTQGRTKDQTETFIASHLLSTLAQTDQLKFPLAVDHRDRPDIRVRMAGETIGIEVTEAVSKPWATFRALAQYVKLNSLLEMPHFGWDAPSRTPAEMRALLNQAGLTSDGWRGDKPERDWALFIHQSISAKLHKFALPAFEIFPRNWLAIYDNLPLHGVRLHDALACLKPLLEPLLSCPPTFDAIYIQHRQMLVELTLQSDQTFPINNLWN